MAGGAAQHAAEDVAPPLVGGDDAVGNQKHGGADVVGDHAQRHVGRRGRAAVLHAGDLADLAHNVADGIHFEQVTHALHDRRQTLQPHAGVDVRVRETGVVAVPVAVELREHDVPDFDEAVAVAARTAVGLAAAEFRAAVKVDFRAGAAGTRADLPEVVVLAELGNPLARDAGLDPDFQRLVVLNVHARIQARLGDFQHLGQELPRPRNRLLLEIIPEGEVAEHFKKRAVARGFAHVVDVQRAHALLAGGHALARGHALALEIGLERRHAGVDEQQRIVVLRYEREALQPQVAFAFKKREVFLPQNIQ